MDTNPDDTPAPNREPRRDPGGRFQASLPRHELLDGVAAVARRVAQQVGCPAEQVSKAAWNRGRAATGLDLPTAEAVRKRLDRSWRDVLGMALGGPADRMYRHGVLAAHPVYAGDEDLIISALRWAALQVGHSPRPAEYDLAVEQWNIHAKKHQGRPMLPVSETILRRMRWPEATRRAGLSPLRKPGARRAQPLAQLIDRCITETGVLPTKDWFRKWARLEDIRVGRQVMNEWRRSLQAALRARRQRGDAIPDRVRPLPPLPSAPSRARRRCTRADALRSLRVYGDRYLHAGHAPRQKHYQVCSAGDPELVSSAVLGRFGRFQDLCREAGL